jgi:hypothetical protein
MDSQKGLEVCLMDTIRDNKELEFHEKLSESNLNGKIFHLQEHVKNSHSDFEYNPIGGLINFEEQNSQNYFNGENVIIELFKNDNFLNFEEKLNVTRIVFGYFTNFGFFEDFYEEECHLAMVNWIYKYKKILQNENETPSQIFDLINNILNIFEILPIKVEELFSLNIYEKLNKIRKIIKNKNFIIYQKLDRLLCYWSSFCLEKYFLNKKKGREVENDSEERRGKKVNFIYLYLYFNF